MNVAEYRASRRPAKSKYGNKHAKEDGYTFDSLAELRRYRELKLLVKANAIAELVVHPVRYLTVEGVCVGSYEADFSYMENGGLKFEDVKGVETAVFKLKAKLFRALYPSWELRIIPVK